MDFPQKPLAWFSKFYLRVQSKNCGKNSLFLFSFQNFFRNLSENFSDFWPKKLQEVLKNYLLRVQRNNLWLEIFFFFFFSEFFRILSENFQTSGQKTSRICQNYLLRVQRDSLWLDFFKVLNRFRFSAETFGMVLKILSTCPEKKLRKK